MSTTRTKFGLRLTLDDLGQWTSADGYAIGRVRALTLCDAPHPERWRHEGGWMMTGHCPGGEEHDVPAGWDIRPAPRGMADDLYPTLTAAWEALAKVLA